jgi:2'-5' RNA ligase
MNKRLFIAIPILPEALLISQKAFLIQNLAEEKINWVKEENIHLTLKFIGNTPEKRIPEIVKSLNNCAKNFDAFSLVLERIAIFGSSYNARVIWVGIRENIHLQQLHECILKELKKVGYPIDRQNFVPHFTLGRIKNIKHKDHFKRVMENVEKGFFQETEVGCFVLFESVLTPDGPFYNTINQFDFKGK